MNGAQGEVAKADGMQAAADGAGAEWADVAQALVLQVAAARATFTTDDLWAAGLPPSASPRALGSVMNAMARAGQIEATGEHRKSTRPRNHSHPVAVWRLAGTAAPGRSMTPAPPRAQLALCVGPLRVAYKQSTDAATKAALAALGQWVLQNSGTSSEPDHQVPQPAGPA